VGGDEIVDRIARQAGVPGLVELLADRLAPTDLQSLLLAVYRRRAAGLTPADLLRQYERNRFPQPSAADPALLDDLDRLAFSLLPGGYQRVELSPVCPLGTSSVLGGVSQDWAVATVRNTEVLGDSTNALALECARRRQQARRSQGPAAAPVKLCASHRLLRGQSYRDPRLRAHFRLLGLVVAGRDRGGWQFELASLVEQLDFHLRLLAAAADLGVPVEAVRVSVTDLEDGRRSALLDRELLGPLSRRHPGVEVGFDPDRAGGRGYYTGACFHVHARDRTGTRLQLVDGGFTDWTRQLASDRKERLLISGIGTELLCTRAGPDAAAADAPAR
jgi:hypothetical protein